MADLRIVDAPLLSTVKGTEKIPTGGEGNFSVSVNQVADFAKLKWVLATEGYVDNAVGNVQADLSIHKNNKSNPHNVTKTQVGLGNVDNTADLDKPVSNATQSAIITANSGKADKSYVDSQDQLKANKTYVDSALLTKADKTYTDSQLTLKADKTYVDSQDQLKADKVYVDTQNNLKADKTTTYTKAETDSLVTPKADKTYVDSAVGAISTDASKQYATLALANADIANIPLNKNIFVSEATNGGYWYKATAGATSLTKSPYDPLAQAKAYTDDFATVKRKEFSGSNADSLLTEGDYFVTTTTATNGSNFPFNEAATINIRVTSWASLTQEFSGVVSGKKALRFMNAAGVWSAFDYVATERGVTSTINAEVLSNVKITTKELPNGTDLNNVTSEGKHSCSSSSNATLALNFPVPLAGYAEVLPTNYDALIQRYTVFSNGDIYIRSKLASNLWTAWEKVAKSKDVDAIAYPSHLEWQGLYDSSLVYFDGSTKTVTIPNYITAPCYKVASNRVRLYNVNFTFSVNNQVAFIDLKELVSESNIDNTNAATLIKIKTYSDTSGFQLKHGQIALVKYDSNLNKVFPCAGFIDVINKNTVAYDSELIDFKKTADDLSVYFPTSSSKKVRINLWHQIVGDSDLSNGMSNSDIWRINGLWGSNESATFDHQILANSGEWSLAIQHSDNTQSNGITKDFVGGWHGDELQNYIKFYIDGTEYNQDFISSLKSAKEVQVVQKSTIYFQNTNIALCDHVQVLTFNKDGLHSRKKIEWLSNTNIQKIFGTMLPILRNAVTGYVTNKSARSFEYYTQVDDNSTAGFAMRYTPVKDGDSFKQWGTSGFSCETKIIKLPNKFSSQSAFISSAVEYNKLYVSPINAANNTENYPVTIGDVWEFETQYLFNYIR